MTFTILNELKVSGMPAALQAFQSKLCREGDIRSLLATFLPMPEPLQYIFYGSIQIGERRYTHWRYEPMQRKQQWLRLAEFPTCPAAVPIALTALEKEALQKEFGYIDSVHWCTDHWGTSEPDTDIAVVQSQRRRALTISFKTLHTSPDEGVRRIMAQFPALKFYYRRKRADEKEWRSLNSTRQD